MLFLSHSGADAAAVLELARRLRAAGLEVWLDLERLQPGDRWMESLEDALRQASAFAVYVGSSGIVRWVDREVRAALERNTADPSFRIIPILGAGAAGPETLPHFLSQHQALDARAELSGDQLKRLIGALLDRPATAVSLLPPGTAPFRGLEYFDVQDAHLYFGRDHETRDLLEKLRLDCFLAVVGASGSGKSSLVRAGLIPALHRGRFQDDGSLPAAWRVAICRPGQRPFRALAEAIPDLAPEMPAAERMRTIRECRRQLQDDTTEGLANCIAALVPRGHRTLLVVDQFEEIFTLNEPEGRRQLIQSERRQFIDCLLRITERTGDRPVHVLITLRADFYSRCWEHPELPRRIAANQHAARPMQRAQLKEIIEKPLALAGASFEEGLSDLILRDAGHEPGCLPLVEHALLQLWERRQGDLLTHAAYNEIGGVSGALAHHADQILGRLNGDNEREIARKIFLRLTQLGVGTEDTRRRAGREEIGSLGTDQAIAQKVLEKLAAADARLVVTRREGESDVVEVAHEALIREWPQLREWIDADRVALRIERRLIDIATEWVRLNRDPEALLRGAQLVEAQEWAQHNQNWEDLEAHQQEFLQASINARDQTIREADERRKRKLRQLQLTAAVLGAAFLIAAFTTFYALRANARAEANFALAKNAVDESLSLVDRDPQHYALVGPDDPEVEALRGELLRRAQPFYLNFIKQKPDHREVREGLAFAHFKLGHINRALDIPGEATREYRDAVAGFERLVEEQPAHAPYRQALANAYNWLGEALRQLGDSAAPAMLAYDRAFALQQGLHRSYPDNNEYRRELARTVSNRGILRSWSAGTDRVAFATAEADFRKAITLLEPLTNDSANARPLQELGRAYNNLGSLIAFDQNRLEEAQQWYDRAIAVHQQLMGYSPTNRDYKLELVKFYNNTADVLRELLQVEPAKQRNRSALDLLEDLARPAPVLRINLADAHNVRGRILESQGLAATLQEYRLSLQLFQRLQTDPQVWSLPEFYERFEELVTNLVALADEHPSETGLRQTLTDATQSYIQLATRIAATGTPADARLIHKSCSRVAPLLAGEHARAITMAFDSLQPRTRGQSSQC